MRCLYFAHGSHPITSDRCLFFTPPAASTLLPWRAKGGGFPLDNRVPPIICARCFPYSRDTRWRSPRWKKWRRRENASLTRIGGAWIAKLPDNGMAQCNLCAADFSVSSGGRTDVCRQPESARHAKLAKSKGGVTRWDAVAATRRGRCSPSRLRRAIALARNRSR